jgi:hypothetical protein
MQLQTQPHRQAVRKNPFRQFARVRSFPSAGRIGGYRRKQYLMNSSR